MSKLKIVRMIYSPVNGGFWSRSYSAFKGILFATQYPLNDDTELMKDLEVATVGAACEIKTMYL